MEGRLGGGGKILRYLDDDEAGAAVVGALVVDGGLVVGDVEAFDGITLLDLIDRGGQSSRLAYRRKGQGRCQLHGGGSKWNLGY